MPYSPLGRGFLTGTITDPGVLSADDFRRHLPRFQAETMRKNQLLLERLQQVATRYDATLAQIALAWVMSKGEDIVPIRGRGKLLTCATMPAPRILLSRRRTSSPSNIFSLPTTSLAYAIPGAILI
ncbi:aldo/keto reductase [Klebsiella pneumoniae subsp. pneumoniae]|nr:aldo/keto reductase [Klebsiella pneumoniae subsp. pneumoniae]